MQARILFALSRCVQDDTSATLRARAVAANLEVRESIVPALRVHADGTLAAGHPERAAYLLGAAEAAHVALAAVYPDADLNRLPESDDTVRRVTDGARCVLGNEAFTGAWTAGKALCLEEAIFALLAEN